ncbi:MerR family transcriptional regulator [Sphingomonas sp. BT-65]|uniref:MerR family transcriptional regulator n=1 Tax=Sphingomonas sp. BT-65 TaxID=2989821 RepID=UPI0022360C2A|nr:MerR family transcriptional regulator [Sphingomonas sp. BT-65]MCW4461358.1 MerR family transcriptional regulator [Sphingomonas sp. BT-65]
MADMTIGALARAGGVGVETVRYYQRRGLLAEPARAGGVRRYGEGDARRLRFIRAAQEAGFTLNEIGELLELDAGEDRVRAHALAQARIAAIDAEVAKLTAARGALEKLARRCAAGEGEGCPILGAFER